MDTLRRVTVVTVVFIVLGIGLMAAGTTRIIQTRTFIASATAADGQVVDLEPNHRSRRTTDYAVFAFKDATGLSHTNRTTSAHRPPPFPVGSKITVLYPVGLPESAQIKSFRTLWFLPTLLFGFGFSFTAIGVAALRAARKPTAASS
jgi:hypothetical protein